MDGMTDNLVRDLVNDDYGVIVMCSAIATSSFRTNFWESTACQLDSRPAGVTIYAAMLEGLFCQGVSPWLNAWQ
jgi:hypothetical protein